MKTTTKQPSHTLLILLLALFMTPHGASSMGNSGTNYQLESAVLASGGRPVAGGDFELNGTLGQPFAEQSSGDDFNLYSGFWPTLKSNDDIIFRSDFE